MSPHADDDNPQERTFERQYLWCNVCGDTVMYRVLNTVHHALTGNSFNAYSEYTALQRLLAHRQQHVSSAELTPP